MTRHVLPLMVNRTDRPYPPFSVLNTGSVRFDIFKGPFTRNDQVSTAADDYEVGMLTPLLLSVDHTAFQSVSSVFVIARG